MAGRHSSLPGSWRKGGKRRSVGGKAGASSPWSASVVLRPKTCLTILSVLFTFLFLFQGGFMATFFWSNAGGKTSTSTSAISGGGARNSVVAAWRARRRNAEVGEAVVDITMKALYDKIAFDDRDGGVWKQGWDVRYQGAEWDREKLKVFVVPHSHNDPGWIRTVEEYYRERTKSILDTVVASLLKVLPLPSLPFPLLRISANCRLILPFRSICFPTLRNVFHKFNPYPLSNQHSLCNGFIVEIHLLGLAFILAFVLMVKNAGCEMVIRDAFGDVPVLLILGDFSAARFGRILTRFEMSTRC